jgi:RND family efflux transporter MFP subunit
MELVVNVAESQLGQVSEGQGVQLEVTAFPQHPFAGTVTSIAPTIDAKTRTAAVRIVPRDDQHQLKAGMFARLSIITAARDNAMLVPHDAILGGTPPAVLTIDADHHIHKQPVQLGLQNDQVSEILSGLDDGQLVATSSLSDLNDGDVVAPQVDNRTALAR